MVSPPGNGAVSGIRFEIIKSTNDIDIDIEIAG